MPRKLFDDPSDAMTLTVGELIEKLKEFPPDALTAYYWEGQHVPVTIKSIEIGAAPYIPENETVVVLDAEWQ